MKQRERDVAWDDEFWPEPLWLGSAHAVSDRAPDAAPVILVPDGAGDYREHQVVERPRRRLGF
jgi:hypothetical protein